MTTPKKKTPRTIKLTGGQVQDLTHAIGEREYRLREYRQADERVGRLIAEFAAAGGHKENGVLWEITRTDDDVNLVEVLRDAVD